MWPVKVHANERRRTQTKASNQAGSQLHTIQHYTIRSGPPREFLRSLVNNVVSTLDWTQGGLGLCFYPSGSSCNVEFKSEV